MQKGDIEDELRELGKQVKSAREFRRLTLANLAAETGLGLQTVLRIEAGSTGVGVLNLRKVLDALGLPATLVPRDIPPGSISVCHPLHVNTPETEAVLDAAVSAACEVLDDWLGVKHPEVDGISSNFQGQLREHLEAMVCGIPGKMPSYRRDLHELVYSDRSVGGPLTAPENDGWVIRVRDRDTVLQGRSEYPIGHRDVDPYTSRMAALDGFRDYVVMEGHPPGPVDAVPVYFDSSRDVGYKF